MAGRLQILTASELDTQIADLVAHHEPRDGWRYEELDPGMRTAWSDMLLGCRMQIEAFDLTAKLSQNQTEADKQGITQGLRRRSAYGDDAVAGFVENFNGSERSISDGLKQTAGKEPC